MKEKLILYYQKLSLVQKLSVPLLVASIFGVILTLVIVKQVQLIDDNTIFLKDELIPTLEKSNNNLALLQKITETLTFATLAAEEEMVLEILDDKVIENNLRSMLSNKNLELSNVQLYLDSFQSYFVVAKQYALLMIQRTSLSESDANQAEALIVKHNETKEYFEQLKSQVESRITLRAASNHQLSSEVIYFTIIFIVVFAIVLYFTSYINYREFNDYHVIQHQREELIQINQKVQDSIEYAGLMQKSILPLESTFNGYTSQYMICWQPKDTVGGDIYFVDELENKKEIVIMVIDGVGHGVSGAFLTILVKAIQTQIIARINKDEMESSPAEMLRYFNRTIKKMLKQEAGSPSNSGFDGGIMIYNRETKTCKYAGAKLPLYIVNNGEVEVVKGNRSSVGFIRTAMTQTYTDYTLDVQKGAKYYMITDGMVDQEGPDNTQYGKKRFKELVLENHHKFFLEQKGLMFNDFHQFRADCEQSDDITVLGMQFI